MTLGSQGACPATLTAPARPLTTESTLTLGYDGRVLYRLAADFVLIFHLTFVGFVVFGSLLVVRWRKVMPFHIAAALWGVLVELTGIICPLTPLEVKLRQLGGEAGYSGGFIEHYIVGVLYPEGLTRGVQLWLGAGALLINVAAYAYVFWRRRRVTPA